MENRHYLIKYAQTCMHFQNKNLNIGLGQVKKKNCLFFLQRDSGYLYLSLHNLEITINN